jgi:hypothetical protein
VLVEDKPFLVHRTVSCVGVRTHNSKTGVICWVAIHKLLCTPRFQPLGFANSGKSDSRQTSDRGFPHLDGHGCEPVANGIGKQIRKLSKSKQEPESEQEQEQGRNRAGAGAGSEQDRSRTSGLEQGRSRTGVGKESERSRSRSRSRGRTGTGSEPVRSRFGPAFTESDGSHPKSRVARDRSGGITIGPC